MAANHVNLGRTGQPSRSRLDLVSLYGSAVRALSKECQDDTYLSAALGLAADYLDKARQYIQVEEYERLDAEVRARLGEGK